MDTFRTGLLLLVVAVGTTAVELWTAGTETVYSYHARLDATTMFPAEKASQWFLTGHLVVQGAVGEATLQLRDLQVSTYNGGRDHDEQMLATPLPEQAAQLSQPFIIHYDSGLAVGLSVKAGEETWSINMKRGLASLLQLDLARIDTPAFVSPENGLHGLCSAEYAVCHVNETTSVRKFVDFTTCIGYPTQSYSSAQKVLCPTDVPQETVSLSSVRTYVLGPFLQEMEADGAIYLQPYRAQSEAHFLWSRVRLRLVQQSDIENQISVKGGGVRVDLTYQVPGKDISQGRSPPSQQELLAAVVTILGELSDNLERHDLDVNLTSLHEERITHVLYYLSLLNHTSLKRLYSELAVGTSYRRETLRNLFLEMLPQVGSRDAMILVRDLVVEKTLKNDTAIRLLSILPFAVREPSEQLLADFEVLLTLPQDVEVYQTAVLSFATLVNKVCIAGCAPELLDKYVGQYLDLFTGSEQYERQMLYLEAIGNFELERVVQFLEPIIRGDDSKYTSHIRFLAIWTTMSQAPLYPEQMYQLYWPLLTNRSEGLEIRVAALTMLVLSRPMLSRFHNLMSFMLDEPDPHLQYYWYTTLQSLIDTHYPCYLHLGDVAQKVIRFVSEPAVQHWATGNYVLDYADVKHGFGSLAHLFMVANPRTGLPSVFYLDVGSHAMGLSYNQFSVYLKVVGLGDTIKEKLVQTDPRLLDIAQLVQLLGQLNLPSKHSEPVHIEFLLKVQNKVVLVHHANQTTFGSLFEVLNVVRLLANSGVHLNAQNLMVPFLLEETLATDLGTTALLRVSASWLLSARANLTAGSHTSSELELRSSLSYQTALTQYNPILSVWHGVQRSLNLQVNVPFNLQLTVGPEQGHVKVRFQQTPGEEGGIVGHVRTVVFVRGVAAVTKLESHCPSCPTHLVVTDRGDRPSLQHLLQIESSGIMAELALFDCEHSYDEDEFSALLEHITKFQNHRVFPAMKAALTLVHLFDYLMLVPPSGSCGLLARLSPVGLKPTEVVVTLHGTRREQSTESLEPLPSGEYNVHLTLEHSPESDDSPDWSLGVKYKHSQALSNQRLTAALTVHENNVMCFDLRAEFPEPMVAASSLMDLQSHSASMQLSATWGRPSDGLLCPITSGLQITVNGEVTAEQYALAEEGKEWPYGSCRNDLLDEKQWGTRYAPLTRACYEMARELSTLRRYNITVLSNNLPTWTDAMLKLLPSNLLRSLSSNTTVQLEVPAHARPVVTLDSHKLTLGAAVGSKLQPWLINTQFPPLLQLATHVAVIGSCVLTPYSVWTLDGANLSTPVLSCYTLAAADCSPSPHFALFVKKVEGAASPLALKLHTGAGSVEVLPHADEVMVLLDGKQLSNLHEGYSCPVGEEHYVWRVWQQQDGLIRIYLSTAHLWLEYYGHFATVTLPGLYRGDLCGLCGDHNGHAGNDKVDLFMLPCHEESS